MFELESSSLGVNIFGHHAVLKHICGFSRDALFLTVCMAGKSFSVWKMVLLQKFFCGSSGHQQNGDVEQFECEEEI